MSEDYQYIAIQQPHQGQTYRFRVKLMPNSNGDWEASIIALPECRAWGFTKEEALEAIASTAQNYVRALLAKGVGIPTDSETTGEHTVTVVL